MRMTARLVCIALVSAFCIPAHAASGEVFVRLPAGSSHAGGGAKIRIVSYSFGSPSSFGEWIADTERPSSHPGRGIDIASVDGEILPPAGRPQGMASSGKATAGPNRRPRSMTAAAPPDSGSLLLTLNSPWPDCRVGKRYPQLELGGTGTTYRLKDAVITNCAAGGAGATKSLSLDYRKLER
jgi:hypothetical protein